MLFGVAPLAAMLLDTYVMLFGVVSLATVEDLQMLDPAIALDAVSVGREGEQSCRLATDPASAELTPLSEGGGRTERG